MSINVVTYGSDYISLFRDSTLPNVLNFRFYLFYCNQKEKDIQIFSIIIILIYQKLGSVGPVQQKIKLPSPYLPTSFENGFRVVTFLRECFSLWNYMKAVLCFFTLNHSFSKYAKFSEKLVLLTP